MTFSEIQAQIASDLVEEIIAGTPDLILKEIAKRDQLIKDANNLISGARARIQENKDLLELANSLLPEKLEEAIAANKKQLAMLEKMEVALDAKYKERFQARVMEIQQKIEGLERNKIEAEEISQSDIADIKQKIIGAEEAILEDQERIQFAQKAINILERRREMLKEQRDNVLKIQSAGQESPDSLVNIEQQSTVQCRFM